MKEYQDMGLRDNQVPKLQALMPSELTIRMCSNIHPHCTRTLTELGNGNIRSCSNGASARRKAISDSRLQFKFKFSLRLAFVFLFLC